jgi:hypothetical protein
MVLSDCAHRRQILDSDSNLFRQRENHWQTGTSNPMTHCLTGARATRSTKTDAFRLSRRALR